MPVPLAMRRRPRRRLNWQGAAPVPAAPVTTLPSHIVDLRVELLLGALGWTDISGYVLQNRSGPGVTITRGHADESVTTTPASLVQYLKNQDGRFTDLNPTGPYYGLIGPNTNVRVSVPEGASYLRIAADQSSGASCPDVPLLGVTGDMEVQLDVTLDSWNDYQALAGKWTAAGNQRAWLLLLNEAGTLTFAWTPDGSTVSSATSTAMVPYPGLGRQALKVTLAVATGTVTFWTAPASLNQVTLGPITSGWVQLGSAVVVGAAAVFDSTAVVTAGYVPGATDYTATGIYGKVHKLTVLSGIGGTAVASPDFTTASPGLSSISDAQGNVWALQGTSEISNRRYKFHGEVAAWPQGWDPTGTDVYVAVSAAGLLRRLLQRGKPLYSAIRRYWTLATSSAVVAYWPMEDQSGSTQFQSGLPGGQPMYWTGNPSLAVDSSFACSGALPQPSGAVMFGRVGAYTPGNIQSVLFLLDGTAADYAAGACPAAFFTTGTASWVWVAMNPGGNITAEALASDGSVLATVSTTSGAYSNAGVMVQVTLNCALIPAQLQLFVMTKAGAIEGATATYSGSTGAVTAVQPSPAPGVSGFLGALTTSGCGHYVVVNGPVTLSSLASRFAANSGEAAAARFARLCSEEGIPSRIVGNADNSVLMGAQSQSTFTSLIQECADADRGIIFEPRHVLGLGYRCSGSLQNQPAAVALDYSQAQLSPPLSPTRDDQYTRNDVTVTRSGGSSAEAIVATGPMSAAAPPAGAGTYDTGATINLASDAQVASLAGWLAHMGTVNQPRYPSLAVDLARSELAGLYYDLQDLDLGARLTVADTPAWLPPDGISQLVQGETVNIGGYVYTIAWNAVPEQPWRTFRVGDHIGTDGSTLAGAIGPADTSMTVLSSGQPWTTADVPFDIAIGGERITVTAVTGAASPQVMTVTRSVNGVVKSHLAGEPLDLFTPAIVPLT